LCADALGVLLKADARHADHCETPLGQQGKGGGTHPSATHQWPLQATRLDAA